MSDPKFFLETFTGRKVNLENPDPSMIDIEDIAHSLSMQCRFNGHIDKFYSVAEHSILLHDYLLGHPETEPVWGRRLGFAAEALLHDAVEAYIADAPKPLKDAYPALWELEDKFDKVIRAKFGLPLKISPEVKLLDRRIITNEHEQIPPIAGRNEWVSDANPSLPDVTMRYYSPKEAESQFLQRYTLWQGMLIDAA